MCENEYLEHLHQLWEKNRPDHLPSTPRYPFGEVLLTTYLKRWAERKPNHPVLIYYGKEMTFAELEDHSSRFAAFLQSIGLQPGDKVAVFLPNCPQFHIVFYGILKAGCIHVPVNPMFKEQELLYELKDSGAKLIVTLDDLLQIVDSVKALSSLQSVIVTRLADFLPEHPTIPIHKSMVGNQRMNESLHSIEVLDLMGTLKNQSPDFHEVDVHLDDVAALNYTGGTTGLPKGCEHTQRDMLYTAATMMTYSLNVQEEDIGLVYIPIFWIAGENNGLTLPVFSGTTMILLTRWDATAVLSAIDQYQVTHFGAVVDHLEELLIHPDVKQYQLHSVRSVFAMSFIKKLNITYRNQWKQLAGEHSIMLEGAYGMTETHTMDTYTNGLQLNDMDLLSEPVFCGIPMPGTEFKIIDFETRELLPLGEKGEIVIRTPSLLKSYWNKPEATEMSLKEGWFYTGDIGMLDSEGYLHFLGRRKEMLKVKGISVFPSEIEVLLGRHEAIEGSAVIGTEDAEKGEIPVAFIRLRPEFKNRVTEEALVDWCRHNMAQYKVPVIKIVDAFPLTATGKVRKEQLKQQLQAITIHSKEE